MPNARRVLVAGATGYLGRHALTAFKARGDFVRALVRSLDRLGPARDSIDEVTVGEITDPASLAGCCEGIDVVFSSVGITRQAGKLTFRDVDYQGNVNLLGQAVGAGVKRFVYVSVFGGPRLTHLAIVKAHEDFVDKLRASSLDYRIVRPTGYFSDMGEFVAMARKGRVFLFGNGDSRINPIAGADLAKVCVDALDGDAKEIDAGGPDVLSMREIGTMALEAAGRPVRITTLPLWLTRAAVTTTKLVNRHKGELLAFLTTMATQDVVAEQRFGTHHLADHFHELAATVPSPA